MAKTGCALEVWGGAALREFRNALNQCVFLAHERTEANFVRESLDEELVGKSLDAMVTAGVVSQSP